MAVVGARSPSEVAKVTVTPLAGVPSVDFTKAETLALDVPFAVSVEAPDVSATDPTLTAALLTAMLAVVVLSLTERVKVSVPVDEPVR